MPITSTIIAVAIPLSFALFSWFFPNSRDEFVLKKDLKELGKKYNKYDLFTLATLFTIVPTLAMGISYLLENLNGFLFSFLGEYELAVLPTMWVWMFAGAMLSFVIYFYLMEWFFTWHLKNDYPEYKAYYNALYNFDGWRVMRWINQLMIFATAIFLVLASAYYTAFYNDHLVYSPFLSFSETRYNYGGIEKLAKVESFRAPNGDIKYIPYFAVFFNDGEIWESRWNGLQDYDADAGIIHFLVSQTGLEVEEVEIIE